MKISGHVQNWLSMDGRWVIWSTTNWINKFFLIASDLGDPPPSPTRSGLTHVLVLEVSVIHNIRIMDFNNTKPI